MTTMAKTILVVDDAQTIRHLTRFALSKGGYNVIEAEDGVQGLKMLEKSSVDLIISDLNMPNMNGFDLLKSIRADPSLKHLPVLMVTAEARKEDIVLAAQSGASGYIVKPFTKATLEEKVLKIVQKMPPRT